MKPKSLLVLLGATAVLVTQTGCIVGIATGSPLMIVGGSLMGLGGLAAGVACDEFCTGATTTLILGGLALDSDNPGRSESLNWIPVDEANATKLSSTVTALEAYNQELGLVMDVNSQIENKLRPIVEGSRTQADLAELAGTVGMTDSKELIRVLSGDRLSRADLTRFAERHSLSQETARIYLKLRFNVRT